MKSNKVRQLRLEKRCRTFERNPLKESYKPRLCDVDASAPVWTLFYRQNEAIFFSQTLPEQTLVFAVENKTNGERGTRRFGVSGLNEFWFYYKSIPDGQRHFYEVIQQDKACHLYFDLEFNRIVNVDKDGVKMVKIWIQYVCNCLKDIFNVVATEHNVLVLDSTTDVKFSQHLIFHVPNYVFKSNFECGCFVHKICDNLKTDKYTYVPSICDEPVDICSLFIQKTDGSRALFVDEGVYSKNRNFRLFMSSKLEKKTELKFDKSCTFPCDEVTPQQSCCRYHDFASDCPKRRKCSGSRFDQTSKEKIIFLASLITNVHPKSQCKVLSFSSGNKETMALSPKSSNTKKRQKTREENTHAVSLQHLPNDLFSELELFVNKLIQMHNPGGYVKRWTHFPSTNVILYDIQGSRYCFNIEREHKSNRIMYVADLKSMQCYQKCYDPDCRSIDYRSEGVCFPQTALTHLVGTASFVDDNELVEVAKTYESEAECLKRAAEFDADVSDLELVNCAQSIESQDEESLSDALLFQAVSEAEAFQDDALAKEFLNE